MNVSNDLANFYLKIEEAAAMVCSMVSEDKLRAVYLWNMISERLQSILNKSAEELSVLALQLEIQKFSEFCDISQVTATTPLLVSTYVPFNSPVKELEQDEAENISDLTVPESFRETEILSVVGNRDVDVLLERSVDNSGIPVTILEQDIPIEHTVHNQSSSQSEEDEVIASILDQEEEANTHRATDTQVNIDACDRENVIPVIVTTNTNHIVEGSVIKSLDTVMPTEEQATSLNNEQFVCEYCSKPFVSSSQLNLHKGEHTGIKTFQCEQCNSYLKCKKTLKRHEKTHSKEKPWSCSVCKASFTESKSLKVHMRRHTGERPYSCSICGKTFSQSNVLRNHIAMHLDQRNYNCSECPRSFRQKSQLRAHEKRHAGIRSYCCVVCHHKFIAKGDLERHKRIHTGERPFSCNMCFARFSRQQALREHVNRHLRRKPYQCKHCGKGFADLSNYCKHVKIHEKRNAQNSSKQNVEQKCSEIAAVTGSYSLEKAADDFVDNTENISCWLEAH